jgi:predicted dehydrogenase
MRKMIQRGDLGKSSTCKGHFFQDWLLKETDYNWRLLASEGGSCERLATSARTGWMR